MVAHASTLCYSGDRDWEGCGLKKAQAKSEILSETIRCVPCACHPSYAQSLSRRIAVQAGPGKNVRSILKITIEKRAGYLAQVVEDQQP
jgi:hypothetical protein